MSADDQLLADRYRLAEVLGTGGAGEVRRAWDTVLRRNVAIKLFQGGCDAAGPRRFDNEIRTLAGLSHPGLVSVYDAGTDGPTPFVVLQLVDGVTLRDRIARGPMPVAEVCELGSSLAEALAHVHDHGVVHRDVKPSNILLDRDGAAHLADFGLARVAGSPRLTRADQFVGTAAYLAPEQVRGTEITPAVDVYALGLVLLECVTGRREYEGSEIETAVARLHRPVHIPDDLPFALTRLLTLMTSLSARRRPSAHECAGALRAINRSGAARPTADAPTRIEHRPTRPHKPALLAAASAIALVAGLGSVIAARDTAPINSTPPASTAPPAAGKAPIGGQTPQSVAQPVQQDVPATSTVVAPGPVEDKDTAEKAKGGKGKSGRGNGRNG
ncbi:hypothetical protein Lesp02_44080 [Lentzea sp. NBRC 105346]|uniref:serine/threonine-protein kinase n=1 Tax=Lentzea sp. NBRC 105346 TaxID=3032205 RepID=UPI0024A3AF27|nr:serine/threonine-protein kinase [Lentzea sp. NBRC 105346]GLZ32220.1 hypothetical protein Lesp02_44080 [Lentzea sp. NBRC 105346]